VDVFHGPILPAGKEGRIGPPLILRLGKGRGGSLGIFLGTAADAPEPAGLFG